MCGSPLLEKSLQIFLRGHVSLYKECDFVIADRPVEIEKPCFIIGNGADSVLKKPFTRVQLMLAVEKFYKALVPAQPVPSDIGNAQQLKAEIRAATEEYLAKVYAAIDRLDHADGR